MSPKVGSFRPRIAEIAGIKRPCRRSKIARQTAPWILQYPPFGTIDCHGPETCVDNSQTIKQWLFSLGFPPASTTDREMVARWRCEYAMYRLIDMRHQPHILAILKIYARHAVTRLPVWPTPHPGVIAQAEYQPECSHWLALHSCNIAIGSIGLWSFCLACHCSTALLMSRRAADVATTWIGLGPSLLSGLTNMPFPPDHLPARSRVCKSARTRPSESTSRTRPHAGCLPPVHADNPRASPTRRYADSDSIHRCPG
jgi:hypothetical protein